MNKRKKGKQRRKAKSNLFNGEICDKCNKNFAVGIINKKYLCEDCYYNKKNPQSENKKEKEE